MALPVPHNEYFKPPLLPADRKRRSPSPPRRFVELLSPTKLRALEPQFNYPPIDPHLNFQVQSKESLTNATPKARAESLPQGHGHHRTPSTIEALAEAALATSPESHGRTRKNWGFMNGHARPSQRPYGTHEPPHKRARSEYIPSAQLGLPASRPATSYGRNDGQPPNQGTHQYDSRVEEAALLLNFRTQGWPNHGGSPPQFLPPGLGVQRPHANSFPQDSLHPRPSDGILLPAFDLPESRSQQTHPFSSQIATDTKSTALGHDNSFTHGALTAVYHDVLDTSRDASSRESVDFSISETSDLPKARRGWPKGKLRGPRSRQSLTDKSTGRRVSRKTKEASRTKKGKKSNLSAEGTQSEPFDAKPRRKSFNDFISSEADDVWMPTRSQSVPRDVALIIQEGSTKPSRRKVDVGPETICAGCSTSRQTNKTLGELDEWISCNGCKNWFHIDCAGFKKAIEVRDVDKYFCPACEQEHGKTTYVRKSKRAHASVDYAELQKGVLKTSEESVEHHYIQPIKDGTFRFDPEYFPRMRPELITREYFERSGTFVEPICIPAEWNPRPWKEHQIPGKDGISEANEIPEAGPLDNFSLEDFEYDDEPDLGQDRLGMVMPEELTVRQVCNLVGADYPLDVIDVKTQNSGAKWTLGKWADYYEEVGEDKAIRNVISLEVSQTRLGRLLRRPRVVRDIDLQDEVWPQEETDKGKYPKVQFYCLMSCADSYTDFHIDFGGSSVYYHILRGKKTFFFIPPKAKHLKAYEEWNDSPQQNYTFLPDITKECYRVDLHEGDTMLIPSGWIHAVWTPADSLVIGGNFLTRMSFKNQFKVAEIEKNNETPMKFRYPFFQRIMWYTTIQYLEQDPMPEAVSQLFYEGKQFKRDVPIWNDLDGDIAANDCRAGAHNARYYSEAEVEGWPELANFIFRTVMMTMGRVEGISQDRMKRVNASIPKGKGEPLELAKNFGLWVAWKRGNEDPPAWAHPDAVLPNDREEGQQKKLSARALKDMERKEAIAAWRLAPDRMSARVQSKKHVVGATSPAPSSQPDQTHSTPRPVSHTWQIQPNTTPNQPPSGMVNQHPLMQVMGPNGSYLSTPKTSVLGPKRVACDACRKRRIKCKHKDLVQQINNPGSAQSDSMLDPALGSSSLKVEEDSVTSPSLANGLAPLVMNGYGPSTFHGLPAETSASSMLTHGSLSTHQVVGTINRPTEEAVSTLAHSVSVFGEVPKRGRTKACVECRKSKRRCVHDDNGNIDPVKAAESPIPRGSLGIKKRQSFENGTPVPVKKQKKSGPTQGSIEGMQAVDPLLEHSYASQDTFQGYHQPESASTAYAAQQQDPILDPNLFAPLTEQGQGYQLGSLEQIANEVLDMNRRDQGKTSAAPQNGDITQVAEHTVTDNDTPPQDGSVDSGVGLSEDLSVQGATKTMPEPVEMRFERSAPPFSPLSDAPAEVPVLEEDAGVEVSPSESEQTAMAVQLPLYQPPAPVPLSSKGFANHPPPKVDGKSMSPLLNGTSTVKRKREAATTAPPGVKVPKKAKLEAQAQAEAKLQETEDEKFAKLLQQESLGLRRRS